MKDKPVEYEKTPEEIAREQSNPLRLMLQGWKEEVIQAGRDELAKVIVEMRGDRPNLEDIPATTGEGEDLKTRGVFPAFAIRPANQILYDRLPALEQKIRTPAVDAHIKDWFIAMARSDARRLDELALIERAAGGTRAIVLEGATGTGTGGGLIPLPLASLISLERDKVAKIRARATVVGSVGQTLKINTAAKAVATMQLEGAASTDDEPTLGTVTLTKKKMQAGFSASEEMLEDSAFNLVGLFSERAGSSFGALEDVQFCTADGTGANMTEGFDQASITQEGDNVDSIDVTDMIDLFYGLPEPYRSTAMWFANSVTLAFMAQILDMNGRPIMQPLFGPASVLGDIPSGLGVVGTIFSRPVVDLPVANGGLYFGDMRFYWILDGGSITAKASSDAGWTTDSVLFKFTQRLDGAVATTDAFRKKAGITAGSSGGS